MPDYLTEVEAQLVQLTERGRHRRRRRGVDAALLAVPVAVVAAVVVAVAGIGGAAHRSLAPGHHGPAGHDRRVAPPHALPRHVIEAPSAEIPPSALSAPAPVGRPVGAGFGPESFTATGEYTWWLLGQAPCARPPCTSIVRTRDGGRTFVRIPGPATSGVSQLRFADSRNGFAYGPQLWATHNGGATWQQLLVHGVVTDLFATDGWVYAIVRLRDGQGVLVRSPAGEDRWAALVAAGDAFSGLWAQGQQVLLGTGNGEINALMSSNDRGASFRRYPVPPSIACQFESPTPPVVWEHCATGMQSGTWRSADGGRSFVGAAEPAMPNSAAFAAASATTAVVGFQELYRTTDGGANWSPVRGPSGISFWEYLGFTDPTHGVAIGYAGTNIPKHERLYYTTDGGASYHRVMIR